MKRREFIWGLGATAILPIAGRAQQRERMRRIGVLMAGTATESPEQAYLAAFLQGLRQTGWTDGQNVEVVVRWNAGDAALARIYAAQLIGLMPDVILANSTTNLTIIREATTTLPVVFTQVSDPVEQGFVASLAKPGGNLTGFSAFEFAVGGKWLGLLKEIAPALARVGVMFNPDTSPQSKFFMRAIEKASASLGVAATELPVRATTDIEPVIENFVRLPNGGLILPTDTFLRLRTNLIADLAIRHRLPSLGTNDGYAKVGGLMYYSVQINVTDQFRQAGGYVARILSGEKPGDLPVQNATRYELVINAKTAKSLDLTIPPNLLAIADEVIE